MRDLEPSCNEERDFIALLEPSHSAEVIQRIRTRVSITRQVGDIMTMGSFQGKDLTLFCNGKLILKGFDGGREEAEAYLEALLA